MFIDYFFLLIRKGIYSETNILMEEKPAVLFDLKILQKWKKVISI